MANNQLALINILITAHTDTAHTEHTLQLLPPFAISQKILKTKGHIHTRIDHLDKISSSIKTPSKKYIQKPVMSTSVFN